IGLRTLKLTRGVHVLSHCRDGEQHRRHHQPSEKKLHCLVHVHSLYLRLIRVLAHALSDESLTTREPYLMWAHVPRWTAHVAMGFRSLTKVSRDTKQEVIKSKSNHCLIFLSLSLTI